MRLTLRLRQNRWVEEALLSLEKFQQTIQEDGFVEWEEVYTNAYYGTLKSEIERIWSQGQIVIFDVDGLVFPVHHFLLVETVGRVDLLHVKLEFVVVADDYPKPFDSCLLFVKFHAEGCDVRDCAVPISVEFCFEELPGSNVEWAPSRI